MIKLKGRELFQWEIDREITVTDIEFDELHFDNVFLTKSLVTKPAKSSGGIIPNVLLQFATPITVYAVKNEKVLEAATFEVTAKAKPEDYFIFDENDYRGIIKLLGGDSTTPSIAKVHDTINAINALGLKNLDEKGVSLGSMDYIPTKDIIEAIADIPMNDNAQLEYERGYEEGLTKGAEEGKNAEWSDFWDRYQQNGNRVDYTMGFCGRGWTNELLKPKYNITAEINEEMFTNSSITNLKEVLDNAGVAFEVPSGYYLRTFRKSNITHLGVIDVSKQSNNRYIFQEATKLYSVDKLILDRWGKGAFATSTFQNCFALEHIIFEGAIGNDTNLQWSPINLESAKSIINALVDYSDTAKAFTYTIKFSDITKGLLTAAGNTAPNGTTWCEYAIAKGWNVA